MIVVKNNERIEALNVVKNGRSAIEKEWIPYFKEGDTEFFFSGEGFVNNEIKKSNQRKADTRMNGTLPQYGLNFGDYVDLSGDLESSIVSGRWKVFPEAVLNGSAFTWSNPTTYPTLSKGSHRKSIYYKKDGSLNQNVKERMMYFRFTGDAALAYASDGWTEGYLDLVCEVAMLKVRPGEDFDRHTSVLSIPLLAGYQNLGASTKQNLIDQKILTEFTSNGNDPYKNIQGTWINWFDEGFTWSPFLYGEQMQYVFYEKDDGAEITDSYTSSTSVNSNFGIGIKDVWNFGINGSSSNSRTLTIKTTRNSQQLGNYVMQYAQDIGFSRPPIRIANIEFITQTK